MNRLCFLVAGVLAVAVTGGSALRSFPVYDYGTERAYGADLSKIIEKVKTTGFYKFKADEFVAGTYDIFNGPVFIAYRPEDQVYLRGYYFPRGLSEIFSYGSGDRDIFLRYAPIRRYFLREFFYKFPNAFTPKAAEIAAPEFYFYDVREFVYGEKPVEGNIPVIYVAPQHERPAEFYREKGFRKIAEFGLLSTPVQPSLEVPSSEEFFAPTSSRSTLPLVSYSYDNEFVRRAI